MLLVGHLAAAAADLRAGAGIVEVDVDHVPHVLMGEQASGSKGGWGLLCSRGQVGLRDHIRGLGRRSQSRRAIAGYLRELHGRRRHTVESTRRSSTTRVLRERWAFTPRAKMSPSSSKIIPSPMPMMHSTLWLRFVHDARRAPRVQVVCPFEAPLLVLLICSSFCVPLASLQQPRLGPGRRGSGARDVMDSWPASDQIVSQNSSGSGFCTFAVAPARVACRAANRSASKPSAPFLSQWILVACLRKRAAEFPAYPAFWDAYR